MVTVQYLKAIFHVTAIKSEMCKDNCDGSWTVSFKDKEAVREAIEYVKSEDKLIDAGWFKYFEFKEK
jgi:hypothetical protein